MAPKKGTINNPAGRKKGTPNKVTTELKTWIKALIDDNRAQLETDLMALKPIERWQVIEKLMQYTIPKIQNIEGHLEFDSLTDEGLTQIATDILNRLQNDNTIE